MNSKKTFVLGDIHGAYKALTQVLDQSRFDYEKDTLISLGDTCDGWPDTRKCFDELLKIKNLVYILGNHDFWALRWMEENFREAICERIVEINGGKDKIDFNDKFVAIGKEGEVGCASIIGNSNNKPELSYISEDGFKVYKGTYLIEV